MIQTPAGGAVLLGERNFVRVHARVSGEVEHLAVCAENYANALESTCVTDGFSDLMAQRTHVNTGEQT